jgi:hypothetical protein
VEYFQPHATPFTPLATNEQPTRSLTQPNKWQTEANTEADVEDAEANLVELEDEVVVIEEDAVEALPVERDQRRRIFWTWENIWIRGLLLSLLVVGKVWLPALYFGIIVLGSDIGTWDDLAGDAC